MAPTPEQILSRVVRDVDEDLKHHDIWTEKVDRWYRAWRGVAEPNADAAQWRSQLFPPYILQVIETLAAGTQDPNPRWRVKPRPQASQDMNAIEELSEGAEEIGYLLAAQRHEDGFAKKQAIHRKQGLIAGLSVWKPYWDYVRDDACVEVVDVRDWIWHESSVSVEAAQRITHRVWKTYDDLKLLEQKGVYSNVDELKNARSAHELLASREGDLFNADRTKDRIEVWECWYDGGKRVATVANKTVLLSDRENPFEHGKYPFVAASPIPDLFRIPGVSVVELIEAIQQMLWSLQGRRHESLELVGNAIVMVRDDVLDPSRFIFAPGEQWLVPDKDAVTIWQPDVKSAQITLDAEALLKADIQNIPGASPALLGQANATEQTATEISLLTNLAQRRLAAQKYQFTLADVEVAEHWIKLNSQFLEKERYVSYVGPDGEEGWALIDPELVKQPWRIVVDQMDESLVRQERRAEEQAKLQVALSAVPVMAAIGQPLNMQAFVEDFLDAFGVEDKAKYFSQAPQPAAVAQGGGPQMAPPGAEAPPEGVTAPEASGISSPSNEVSQSPLAAMQRMLSGSGGAVNV